MHPEGRLPFYLLFRLGACVMVNVVVVDVLCALPAHEGVVGAQGQSEGPLVWTGDRGNGCPGPPQGLDSKARAGKQLVLWRARARGVPEHSGRLATGGLQDPGKVLIQDGLRILVRGAREEG